jgi:peptide/nickel transport system substrate-binding protein
MIRSVGPRGIAALVLALAAGGLTACGGSSTSPSSTSTAGGSSTGGGGTSSSAGAARPGKIVIADAAAPDSLDPDGPSASVVPNLTAYNNTYDSLVTYKSADNPANLGGGSTIDANGLAPGLATSWRTTDTKTTLQLRHGVKSAAGNELTSADVVWSYDRAKGLNATAAFVYGVVGGITGVRAKGKYAVEFDTKSASPLLLVSLAQPYTKIYDSTEVRKHVTAKDKWASKWLTAHTAGFGAYAVSAMTPGKTLDLTPVASYWGGKAENAIEMISIPDPSNRYNSLEKGDVNMALNLPPSQLQTAQKANAIHLFRIRGNGLVQVFPNFDVPAFKNAKVRQALQYATPQDQIVDKVYLGFGFPIKSLATSYSPGYTDQFWPYTYDVARAKQLMQEAGYGSGVRTELYYSSDSPTLGTLATILQSSYQQIGVDVKLVARPASELVTRAFGKKDMPMYLTDSATSVIPDISNLGALYRTGGFANVNKYTDKAFDGAYADSVATNDQTKRTAAFQQMQKVAAEDPPSVDAAGLEAVVAASGNVTGYSWQPDQGQVFRTLKVAAG